MDKLCHVATTSVLRGTTYLKKTYKKKKLHKKENCTSLLLLPYYM